MSAQEILNELIVIERGKIEGGDKTGNLLAAQKIQMTEMSARDLFQLIDNSLNIEVDEAYWA